MRSVDRRTFMKGMAAVSAAAVGSSLAPDDLLEAQGVRAAPQEPLWHRAPCTLCSVGCGLLIGVQNGRAGAVKGDPDAPGSRGLACARGYYSVQALYGADRITRALVRRNGALVPASMAAALELVARGIRESADQHGRDSIAVEGGDWTLQDRHVAAKLFGEGVGTSRVPSGAPAGATTSAALIATFGLDGAPGCYEDIDHADVFVLWDANVAETHPVLFSRMLERRRRDRAVRIIDVATRTTRTSYAADDSLLHRPQTLLAVANAVSAELVARGRVNREFIDRHVAFRRGTAGIGHGASDDTLVAESATSVEFQDYARFLAEYTPERAQQISGLPADRVRWLASLYGDPSKKVVSVWGGNVNGSTRGTWTSNTLYNIHLLTGRIGTRGNTAWSLDDGPLSGGTAAAGPAARRSGLSSFRALERGDVRFLWIQGGNPMATLPGADALRRAAQRDDRFVVVSSAYPTATTDVADVVLPAALWFERGGVIASAERRLQQFGRLVPPPGDATEYSWQMIEVARRLGLSRLFPWDRDTYAERAWEEFRAAPGDPAHALPPLSELRGVAGLAWPFANGRETKRRYNTAEDPAADRSRGAFHFYGNPDGRAWVWLRPYEQPVESPDPRYPFWLNAGAVLEHSGSGTLTRRIPTLHRGAPAAYVEMNAEDAQRLGIRAGDPVRLVSPHGSLQLPARVNYRSQPQPGQLFVPWFDETLPVARLMPVAFDPLSGQPHTSTCAVRVERVGQGRGT